MTDVLNVQTEPLSNSADLFKIVGRFQGQHILVLGDVMLDRYWWGAVNRISPEAPVPIVHKQRSSCVPGGAANAAANIVALGGEVSLFGVVGQDDAASELRRALEARQIDCSELLVDVARLTTVKTRIIAHSQHVVRIDEENVTPLTDRHVEKVVSRVEKILPAVKAVLLSDYAKGFLTSQLIRHVINLARSAGKPVLVDPKGTDYARYAGVTVITPNRNELALVTGMRVTNREEAVRAGYHLQQMLDGAAVLVTEGEEGMTLLRQGYPIEHLSACARQVYDVTGAGDTVIATLTLALAAGADLPSAAKLANQAAGLAVEQVGTVAVTRQALLAALNDAGARSTENVSGRETGWVASNFPGP